MQIEGPWFKDEQGRTLILRGVNLGGSNKVPFPNCATHRREGFYDHRNVSFVGRPFPLADAGEHLARLRAWGLTTLRLLVPWEAVEHSGPGLYDEEDLDYLVEVVRRAGEHGLDLFIDPHQDAWSCFSGGDGAPGPTARPGRSPLGGGGRWRRWCVPMPPRWPASLWRWPSTSSIAPSPLPSATPLPSRRRPRSICPTFTIRTATGWRCRMARTRPIGRRSGWSIAIAQTATCTGSGSGQREGVLEPGCGCATG